MAEEWGYPIFQRVYRRVPTKQGVPDFEGEAHRQCGEKRGGQPVISL